MRYERSFDGCFSSTVAARAGKLAAQNIAATSRQKSPGTSTLARFISGVPRTLLL